MCLVACIFILESCAQLCTLTYIIIMIIHKGKHWHLVWLNKIGMFLWSWLGTMWIWIPSTLELLPSRIYIYIYTHAHICIYIYKIYALWGYIFNRLGKPFSCKQLPQKTIENLKDCPLLERCNSFYTTRHRGTFPFVSLKERTMTLDSSFPQNHLQNTMDIHGCPQCIQGSSDVSGQFPIPFPGKSWVTLPTPRLRLHLRVAWIQLVPTKSKG